jgi:hypothetical protein
MSMFQRAWSGANLLPVERAFLKLLEGCVLAGLVAALPVLAQLQANQPISWPAMARQAWPLFAVAALMALVKWLKAQNDTPLAPLAAPAAALVTQLAQSIETQASAGDVTIPFIAPSAPVTSTSSPVVPIVTNTTSTTAIASVTS